MSEEQLALYSGSDLNPQESAAVSEHLTECAACHQALTDLRVSLQLFAETSVAPNCEDLRSVRNGVMERLRKNQRQSRLLQAAAIAASVGLILAPLLLRDKAHDYGTPVIANLETLPPRPIPSLNLPDSMPVIPVHHRRRNRNPIVGLRTVALNTRPDGKSELSISTADPNVVILLEMDGNLHEN